MPSLASRSSTPTHSMPHNLQTSVGGSPGSLESPIPRFSVNSNLMNYSIPKNEQERTRREIQSGDSSTKARQLEGQIEGLTLQNVKLQRTNRLLKVDTDNLIEQKTRPLEEKIRMLTLNNVQLQRVTRLLQQDLEEKTKQMLHIQCEQIMQMKNVGPEYEFLVQMVNLLHRQISGEPTCEDTCCYTLAPIDQSSMVMTLPPENDDQEMEAQHICRPIVHSSISQGSYAIELENKIVRLEQIIDQLEEDKEVAQCQQEYKDNDIEMLKKELRIKDEIVSQLEQDFMALEEQLASLQRENDEHRYNTAFPTHPSPPPEERIRDPRRQSQMLMDSKRRSLAVKDTEALEKMLRGDLQLDTPDTEIMSSDDEFELKKPETRQYKSIDPESAPISILSSFGPVHPIATNESNTPDAIPGAYDQEPFTYGSWNPRDPFVPFVVMAILLGLAAQLGVTDDWTVPITLVTMVSGFLWSGAAKGVQLKVNLN
ncbi:hypothetical protein CLU79DRAFT_754180 [Phycomyces nitens]|nr:hypothetical protein CLU79DRAFT_754180 [Phycomyces nitens]